MKILIPVEAEKLADAQIDFITNHKWPNDLAFHIVYAIEPTFSKEDEVDMNLHDQMTEWNKAKGLKVVNATARKLRKHFGLSEIIETVEVDHASELILEVAEGWKADLIVLGAHGKNASARLRSGSVSTTVLSFAECEVIVVRPARQEGKNEMSATPEDERSGLVHPVL